MLIVGAFAALVVFLFYGGFWVLLLLMLLKLERIRGREEMTATGVAALYFMRFVVLAIAFLPVTEFMAMAISRTHPWPPDDWDSARLTQHCMDELIAAIAAAIGFAVLICSAIYIIGRRRSLRARTA